jgi:hypothetical protein
MPFDSSPQINPNPDVRIFFEGLLILTPGQDATSKRCDVYAINHHSTEHELFVEVSIDEPQPSLPILRIGRKVAQFGLEIGTTSPAGVMKFEPSAAPAAAPYPLREAMDLKTLHPNAQLNSAGLHPVIKIRDVVLYTATHRDREVRILSPQVACRDREPLALIIGANIHLNGRKLQLTWGSDSVELPRAEDSAGAKYIIWIHNSRSVTPMIDTNDFGHFYHGLSGVARGTEFTLDFKKCSDPLLTTSRVPCIPIVSGG